MWIQGQTVLDRYRLVEALGSGAGGETWKAEGPGGPVAVKLIRGEDARAFRDLIREAALLRELRHPNVVGYREFSDRPDEDCAILVLDYVEGGDLEGWRQLVGAVDAAMVARLGLQVVAALEALEAAGVLHRDLKPSNILVELRDTGDPRLRVADFGISRRTREGVAMTVDRSLTPNYAAPEQHLGGTLTRAADLFAVGGVLHFLATGQPPRGGPASTGDDGLDRIVTALRHPDPGQRLDLPTLRALLAARAEGAAVVLPARGPTARAGATLVLPELEGVEPPAAPAERGGARRARLGVVAAVGILAVVVLVAVLPGPRAPEEDRAAEGPAAAQADPGGEAPLPEPVPASPVAEEPDPVVVSAASSPVAPPPAGPRSATPPTAPPATTVALLVNTRPWSWVYLDGTKLGRTTDVGATFLVPAGVHLVRFESEEGLTWERRVEVKAGSRLCVNLRLSTEIAC